ncbi:MAG: elongation factor P [Xanthomonadaceae bacterium]|nr:elongation factor P [Xanthomonadaceae bacterium]
MSSYATNQFRKGLKLEIEGVPYQIVEFQHVSPGKGAAFTRTKLRNLLTTNVTEKSFRSGDKVDSANIEIKEMQYLYKDSEGYHFMNTANYEQVALSEERLAENVGYLQENLQINVMYYNERPIGVELPTFVELKVIESMPGVKGNTSSGAQKIAKLETGAEVSVPLHISEGDILKIDTRDGSYIEKVNK